MSSSSWLLGFLLLLLLIFRDCGSVKRVFTRVPRMSEKKGSSTLAFGTHRSPCRHGYTCDESVHNHTHTHTPTPTWDLILAPPYGIVCTPSLPPLWSASYACRESVKAQIVMMVTTQLTPWHWQEKCEPRDPEDAYRQQLLNVRLACSMCWSCVRLTVVLTEVLQ